MTVESIADLFQGTELGRAFGRKGREEGREGVLIALLRQRFGDDPGLAAVAERLVGWQDDAAAVRAIEQASTLDGVPQTP